MTKTQTAPTKVEVDHFRRMGYLKVSKVYNESIVERAKAFLRNADNEDGSHFTPTGGQRKLYNFVQRSGELGQDLIRNRTLLQALEPILGPNIVVHLNRHNQGTLNEPGEVSPRFHRDVLQWSRNLLTVIIYLSDSTPESGCTYVVPGSHFAPLVGVPQPDGGGTWMDEHCEFDGLRDQALPVPVAAGGVLLMDSLLFHTAGANRSAESRPSIAFGYRSVDELSSASEANNRILVSSATIYRGNDRPFSDRT